MDVGRKLAGRAVELVPGAAVRALGGAGRLGGPRPETAG